MDNVIEAIRAAIMPDASSEEKATGVAACRAIIAALDATAGQTLAPPTPQNPIAAMVGALRGVPPDQLLDLAIAKLRSALPPDVTPTPATPFKLQMVPVPRSLK